MKTDKVSADTVHGFSWSILGIASHHLYRFHASFQGLQAFFSLKKCVGHLSLPQCTRVLEDGIELWHESLSRLCAQRVEPAMDPLQQPVDTQIQAQLSEPSTISTTPLLIPTNKKPKVKMPSDSSSWCLITKNRRTAATLMARNCSLTHHWKRVSKQLHKSIPRTVPKLSGAFGKSDPLTSWDKVEVWLLAFPNFCTLSSCSS